MSEADTITDADILTDAISPNCGDMAEEAARSVLDWKFSETAMRQMRNLSVRHNKGELTSAEQESLDRYRRVGLLLDLIHAKARISLQRSKTAS